jgi:multisubunit Na+/H+ antiporter MnhF subunit
MIASPMRHAVRAMRARTSWARIVRYGPLCAVLGSCVVGAAARAADVSTAAASETATGQINALAPHHLPPFIPGPGQTDILMVVTALFLLGAVLCVGILFLRLHTLPERLAHKSQKLQFEIVAVLGLLALFTHIHLFWVAGLILALIEFPDFSTPLKSMAGSLARMAGRGRRGDVLEPEEEPKPVAQPPEETVPDVIRPVMRQRVGEGG